MSIHWMPLFIGDYLGDTSNLTTEQHGAYLLLLMHHWRTGPLPDDDRKLARITRCNPGMYVRWHAKILRGFFTATPEGLVQKRLMKERQKALDLSEKRTEAGKRGGRPKKESGETNSFLEKTNSFDKKNQKPVQPQPQPQLDKKKGEVHPLTPSRGEVCGPLGFEQFWNAYRKKEARGRAERAYEKAVAAGADPAAILSGLMAWSWPSLDRFVPLAANWLDDKRWLDQPPASIDDQIMRAFKDVADQPLPFPTPWLGPRLVQ